MSITRSLGALVTLGVPAIIGSGFVWHFTSSWEAIYIYLIILALTALGFIDLSRK
ncbi:MAG: hypothetical protein R6T92_03515 [Desulfosalsimonadaceae bacterium]